MCVSRVFCMFLHATVACGTELLDVLGMSRFVWLCLYESLLTYVAHMDLVGDPLQGTCHARVSEILITKICKILYLGFCRIYTWYVASTHLDLSAITNLSGRKIG
jgi:hypothetical protein